MGFIRRDTLTPSMFAWSRCSKIYQLFTKVWTTQIINGVEVYDDNLIFYNQGTVRTDKLFERFINALGIKKADLQQDYSGIKNAYFKLNSKKYNIEIPTEESIADAINFAFGLDDTFDLQIYYSGDNERVITDYFTLNDSSNPNSISSYTIDPNSISNTLLDNPIDLLSNTGDTLVTEALSTAVNDRNTSSSATMSSSNISVASISKILSLAKVTFDTATTNILSTLAVLDDGTVFQNTGITIQPVETKILNSGNVSYTYGFTVSYKKIADVTTTSVLVNQIINELTKIKSSMEYSQRKTYTFTQSNMIKRSTHITDTSIKEALLSLVDVPADSAVLYQGHFRVDGMANMKRKEFVDVLGKIFDTGYTEEDSSFWEKLVAAILVVVAIVVAVVSFGAAGGVSNVLLSVAAALSSAAATLVIGQLLYATAFPTATDMIRLIGKVAQIVGLLAMVTGIYAAIQKAFTTLAQKAGTRAAEEAATDGASKALQQELAENAIQNYGIGDFIQDWFKEQFDVISSKITSVLNPSNFNVKELSTITMKDVSGWMDNLNTGLKLYQQFFGPKSVQWTAEDDQATKEDGVEAIYASYSMLDEVDALSKMDFMIQGNNGGEKTQRLLSKI